jgi:hypothetical protein
MAKAWHDDIRVWLLMAVVAGVASSITAAVVMKQMNIQAAQAKVFASSSAPPSDDETRYHTAAGLAIRHDAGYSRR